MKTTKKLAIAALLTTAFGAANGVQACGDEHGCNGGTPPIQDDSVIIKPESTVDQDGNLVQDARIGQAAETNSGGIDLGDHESKSLGLSINNNPSFTPYTNTGGCPGKSKASSGSVLFGLVSGSTAESGPADPKCAEIVTERNEVALKSDLLKYQKEVSKFLKLADSDPLTLLGMSYQSKPVCDLLGNATEYGMLPKKIWEAPSRDCAAKFAGVAGETVSNAGALSTTVEQETDIVLKSKSVSHKPGFR